MKPSAHFYVALPFFQKCLPFFFIVFLATQQLYGYIQRRVPQMMLDAGKQGTQHPYISQEQLGRVKDVGFFEVGK